MNLYVYGFVTASKTAAGELTVGGHRIELLAIAGLEVAVERLDERPAISESALRRQHAIVTPRLARRFDAVLPATIRIAGDSRRSRANCRPANRRLAERSP